MIDYLYVQLYKFQIMKPRFILFQIFSFDLQAFMLLYQVQSNSKVQLETALKTNARQTQKKLRVEPLRQKLEYFKPSYRQTNVFVQESLRVQLLELSHYLLYFMNNSQTNPAQTSEQVYGFLCQKTNVFYAFESYQTYQQFLVWLESQANTDRQEEGQEPQMMMEELPNQDQQMADFQMATRQILKVFDDPVFDSSQNQMEMRQIDF